MWSDTRNKIITCKEAAEKSAQAINQGKQVVFTNGCFDLIHQGHVRYLGQARNLGDLLMVGLNSDKSVQSLNKGPDRPLVPQEQRAEVMSALAAVDYVIIFDESTPLNLIEAIKPQILAKGGDWEVEKIVGADFVRSRGGKVFSIPLLPGLSTTLLAKKIRQSDHA